MGSGTYRVFLDTRPLVPLTVILAEPVVSLLARQHLWVAEKTIVEVVAEIL